MVMSRMRIDQLSYQTPEGKALLKAVSLCVEEGELVGLVGGNGAGKSTLLKCAVGVQRLSGGQVMLDDKALHDYAPNERAKRMSYIAQSTHAHWPLKVEQTVALGRMPHGAVMHDLRGDDLQAVEQAMRACEVAYLKDRRIHTLSGGEQARVWLARAMATRAPLLLADEPASGLDLHYQLMLMELLRHWCDAGNSALVAIHDLSLAARFCDRLCVLTHGKITGVGTVKQLLEDGVLSNAFGVTLSYQEINGQPVIAAGERIAPSCGEVK
jgi:iron complex transport system ATP-binding protein